MNLLKTAALGAVIVAGVAIIVVEQYETAPVADARAETAAQAQPASQSEPLPGPFDSPAVIKGSIAVAVPDALGGMAALGQPIFAKNCVSCHGENASGTENGPPLVHIIYEPNHHGDGSFYRAALQGVRGHHWRYGDMPPVEGITENQVTAVIAYIRTLQRHNGIE